MNVLIKKVHIINKNSIHHNKICDVLIENGIYTRIEKEIKSSSKFTELKVKNSFLSAGFIDMFANFCEPGNEQAETLQSGSQASALGGFTDVCLIPNTAPCADSAVQINFLRQKSDLVNLLPYGCISKKIEGAELAEMMDMHNAGAIAFTDGIAPVQNAQLMLKALQFAIATNSTLVQMPVHKNLASHTYMHEGIVSTQIGVSAQPAIAESIILQQDIELLKYTNSKLHITGVSTARNIELIKKAKKAGLNITCSCTPYHLLYTDKNVSTYKANYKVQPPLRTEADKKALINACLDGTIDCIASHHQPCTWDEKNCEFANAKFGMSTIETVLQQLLMIPVFAKNINKVVELLTNARAILKIQEPAIAVGQKACSTLFSTTEKFTYNSKTQKSLGVNNVLSNETLNGKIIAIFNNLKHKIHDA